MNDHGYTAANFLAQLPKVLANDSRMNALATAIANALVTHLGDLEEEKIYTRIDELPEDVLDILAHDFKIDWYDYDYPIAAKRNLIKTNYYVHRHLGTVGAVQEAVQAIYPNSAVEEWFDYSGSPYHFRLALESALPVIPFSVEALLTAVYRYKSLRSHLDEIIFRCTLIVGISVKTGYVPYWGRITGTYPARAVQGDMHLAELEVNTTTTDSLTYGVRMCGTVPGGLF